MFVLGKRQPTPVKILRSCPSREDALVRHAQPVSLLGIWLVAYHARGLWPSCGVGLHPVFREFFAFLFVSLQPPGFCSLFFSLFIYILLFSVSWRGGGLERSTSLYAQQCIKDVFVVICPESSNSWKTLGRS